MHAWREEIQGEVRGGGIALPTGSKCTATLFLQNRNSCTRQDDFEAVGVTSREQFEQWAEELPATLLGVLSGKFEGEGSVQQRATVMMLGWQLGCELTEWMGGPSHHFDCCDNSGRNKDLEDVTEAYRIACAMLGMGTDYI